MKKKVFKNLSSVVDDETRIFLHLFTIGVSCLARKNIVLIELKNLYCTDDITCLERPVSWRHLDAILFTVSSTAFVFYGKKFALCLRIGPPPLTLPLPAHNLATPFYYSVFQQLWIISMKREKELKLKMRQTPLEQQQLHSTFFQRKRMIEILSRRIGANPFHVCLTFQTHSLSSSLNFFQIINYK